MNKTTSQMHTKFDPFASKLTICKPVLQCVIGSELFTRQGRALTLGSQLYIYTLRHSSSLEFFCLRKHATVRKNKHISHALVVQLQHSILHINVGECMCVSVCV